MSRREIKTDHWVKTADGAIGRVRYVHQALGTADVAIDGSYDNQESVPLDQLRRIADPAEKLPPIENMPPAAERPRCAYCGKPLRPNVRKHYADMATRRNPLAPDCLKRTFEGWEGYPRYRKDTGPLFDTLSCAERFAIAAHKAGYRIVRKPAAGGEVPREA